jgi:hypothetical protein
MGVQHVFVLMLGNQSFDPMLGIGGINIATHKPGARGGTPQAGF